MLLVASFYPVLLAYIIECRCMTEGVCRDIDISVTQRPSDSGVGAGYSRRTVRRYSRLYRTVGVP